MAFSSKTTTGLWKNSDDMLSRFDTIPAFDKNTGVAYNGIMLHIACES